MQVISNRSYSVQGVGDAAAAAGSGTAATALELKVPAGAPDSALEGHSRMAC